MGAGLPVVATPVGGIVYIVQEEINGLLVPIRSAESLEAALRKLISNPALRAAMGHRNLEQAWARYESAVVTQHIEGHYRSLHALCPRGQFSSKV